MTCSIFCRKLFWYHSSISRPICLQEVWKTTQSIFGGRLGYESRNKWFGLRADGSIYASLSEFHILAHNLWTMRGRSTTFSWILFGHAHFHQKIWNHSTNHVKTMLKAHNPFSTKSGTRHFKFINWRIFRLEDTWVTCSTPQPHVTLQRLMAFGLRVPLQWHDPFKQPYLSDHVYRAPILPDRI